MGAGLRSAVGIALLLTLLVPALNASGSEFVACWTATEQDAYGYSQQATRCRLAGGSVVDYASDSAVPAVLYPMLGTDDSGPCWYYMSTSTGYLIITLYANGDADIIWDPDPDTDGGTAVVGTLRRCTSEPTPADDPAVDAWNYVMSYIHPPPTPDLNPEPGLGVTGLATYVGVDVPEEHSASLSGGFTSLEVEIGVSAIRINWGDGTTNTYPATATAMAGYPDGMAAHVYEVKNDGYTVSVSYAWTARWRVAGGAWQTLSVPDTTTTVDYPVAEIISVLVP